MMKNVYNKLMKNSFVFMVASFGSKLISFILVPFYTHVLSSEQYGTVDVLVATVSLFSPIACLGIGDVVVMFLSKKEYEHKKIFTNAMVLLLAGNVLVSFVYPFLFLNEIFKDYFIYFVMLVVISSLYGIMQMFARGTSRVTACAVSGVLYTLVLGVSNILLLLYFKLGIIGYLLSMVMAYAIPCTYLLIVVKEKSLKVKLIDKKLIINVLKLGIPLMPTAVLWTLMNLADKYAISSFLGVASNGLYAVAHKIPTIISVIYSFFQQAWQLTTFELDSRDERGKTYTEVFEMLTCVVFCTTPFLAIISRLYITHLCDASYLDAWKVSPILMYCSVLNCISGFLGSNYLLMKNTKAALKTTFIGAVINVVLNFVLVPLWGLNGAAIATCSGYFYMVLKKHKDTKEFTPLRLNKYRFGITGVLSIMILLTILIDNTMMYYGINFAILVCMLVNYRKVIHKVIAVIVKRLNINANSEGK